MESIYLTINIKGLKEKIEDKGFQVVEKSEKSLFSCIDRSDIVFIVAPYDKLTYSEISYAIAKKKKVIFAGCVVPEFIYNQVMYIEDYFACPTINDAIMELTLLN